MMKSKNRQNEKFNFTRNYKIDKAHIIEMQLDPNPTDILTGICSQLMVKVSLRAGKLVDNLTFEHFACRTCPPFCT